ncbi:hypothetical protein C8J57DRAFT_1245110 [Mycena rebaudengoi]|nr:hypothetical protein C8J57DRAFT_1245110 [Mycena rebaudengoi]
MTLCDKPSAKRATTSWSCKVIIATILLEKLQFPSVQNGILFFCDYCFLAHVAAGQAEDLAQVKESRGDDCRGGRHLLGGGDEHATERTRAGGDLIAGGDDVRPHPFGTAKVQEGICAFTISNTPELKVT